MRVLRGVKGTGEVVVATVKTEEAINIEELRLQGYDVDTILEAGGEGLYTVTKKIEKTKYKSIKDILEDFSEQAVVDIVNSVVNHISREEVRKQMRYLLENRGGPTRNYETPAEIRAMLRRKKKLNI